MKQFTEQFVSESISQYKPSMKVATLSTLRVAKGTIALAKANGELSMVKYTRGKDIYTINNWGRRRRGFQALNELQRRLDTVPGLKAFEGLFECYAYDWDKGQPLELPEYIHIAKGLHDFSRVRLGAFDAVSVNGESVEDQPFKNRFYILKNAVGTKDGYCHLLPHLQINTQQELKEVYRDQVDKGGYEGLVIRQPDSETFKIKPLMSVDAMIIGLSKEGKTYPEMIRSVKLGLFVGKDTIVEIGNVTIADFDLARAMTKLRNGKCWEDAKTIYIEPSLVIEVVYSGVFESKNTTYGYDDSMQESGTADSVRLKEPRFVRFRKDKFPNVKDCGINQVKRQ
jgi:hypothetical protein